MVAKSKPEELTPKDKPEGRAVGQEAGARSRARQERARAGRAGHAVDAQPRRADAGRDRRRTRRCAARRRGAAGPDGRATATSRAAATARSSRSAASAPRSRAAQDGAGGGAPQVPNLKPSRGGARARARRRLRRSPRRRRQRRRDRALVEALGLRELLQPAQAPGRAELGSRQSVWRRSDPTGTVYGFKTRITEVRVSLSPQGRGREDRRDDAVRRQRARRRGGSRVPRRRRRSRTRPRGWSRRTT